MLGIALGLALVGLFVWGANLYYQPLAPRPAPSPVPAETRDGRWQQDIAYLASELPRLHPNPFFRTSREAFEQLAAKLKARVPRLEDHQLVVGLKHLVALLGDAHTMLALPADWHAYPLALERFEGEFYVSAAAPEYSALVGQRLVQVGDTEVAEAVLHLREVIAHENDAWLGVWAARYLMAAEVLHALDLQVSRLDGRFSLEDARGAKTELTLQALPHETLRELAWQGAP